MKKKIQDPRKKDLTQLLLEVDISHNLQTESKYTVLIHLSLENLFYIHMNIYTENP